MATALQRGVDVTANVRRTARRRTGAADAEKVPPDTSKMLLCPMPGVIAVHRRGEGEQVKAGQPLAVVEAMKMENTLRAERRGVVKRVAIAVGASLAVDEIIMEFD